MPHVDDRVRHWPAVFGQNRAVDIERLALRAAVNVSAQCRFGRIFHVKWTLYRSLSGALGEARIDGVHQHGNAQRIGQQNELLPLVGAKLAGAREGVFW